MLAATLPFVIIYGLFILGEELEDRLRRRQGVRSHATWGFNFGRYAK